MAVVTRFLIERKGQLINDAEGNPLMYVTKAEADAVDRRLDATEVLAELMVGAKVKGVGEETAYQLAEALVGQAEDIQDALKPVIADNRKLSRAD